MNAGSGRSADVVSLLILTGVLAGTCLPAKAQTADLSRDFSLASNPAGAWSYGYEGSLGGAFTLFGFSKTSATQNGVPIEVWAKNTYEYSAVLHNATTNTSTSEGTQGVFPPGTTWFGPGAAGHPDNFCVIRFTVPAGEGGNYQLQTAVQPHLNGPSQGDTDFHLLKNGLEVFGQFLSPTQGVSYSGTLVLAALDTVDFAVGRGADNSDYGSALKIQATLDLVSTNPAAPSIITQPASQTVTVGASVTFRVVADGTAPLSYQWLLNGATLVADTDSSLTLNNVQLGDAGKYSVVVSNSVESATSADAVLTVNPVENPSNSCALPPSGLVGWWPFDGSADDIVGNHQTILVGGPSFTVGEVNQALAFDGTDDYVKVPAAPGLNVGAGDGLTVEGWIKPNDVVVLRPIAEWNNSRGTIGAHFWTSVDGPGSLFANLIDTTNASHQITTVNSLLSAGVFQHVALTYDQASGTAAIYLNGNAVAQTNLGSFTPQTSSDLYLGLRTSGPFSGIYFVGAMDEMSLYNRSLSAGEIQSVFNAGSAGKCITNLPPLITSQPQGQTVTAGADVTFSVTAIGTAPLNFQWRLNGNSIAGANSPTLTLNNVQSSDAGSYSVAVANAVDSVTSADAVLTVNPAPPPGTFDLSQDFSLASNPNGAWSYGYESNLGGSFALFGFSKISPAQNGVPIEVWAKNTYEYAAVFHNATTNIATSDNGQGMFLPGIVEFGPGVRGNPDNFCVIRLTVPIGLDGTYRLQTAVQPYLDGPSQGDTDFHVLKNGTELFGQFLAPTEITGYSNTLTLASGDTVDFAVGRGADNISYGDGLKIQATLDLIGTEPAGPRILVQPQSRTVTAGSSVTFSVAADGTAPLNYQWRFNGNDLAGANAASLTVNNVQTSDAGIYSVAVSNAVDVAISIDARLTVNTGPVQATYDLRRDFSQTANPNGVWSYGWKPTSSGSFNLWTHFYQAVDNAGALIDIWAINHSGPSQVDHNGSNMTGGSDGGQGTFPPGTVWFYPGYEGNTDNFGTIRFTVPLGSSGTYNLETAVHSYLDGPGSGDTDFHLVKNGVELFGQFLPGSSGTGYTNMLTLGEGDTIDFLVGRGLDNHLYGSGLKIQATLDLVDTNPVAPTILMQPRSHSAAIGASVTFKVSADGTAPLSYQWSFNGSSIDGATGGSLTLNNVQPSDAGNYSVAISNVVDSVTSADAVLTVTSGGTPPAITSEPVSEGVEVGASATFIVFASGSEPFIYQWYFDGKAITGATNNSLTIASAQAGDAGTYGVVVSNAFGSVTSMGAVLYLSSGGGGSVNFSNIGEGHVYGVDGTTRLPAGTAFLAQLYAGPTVDSLQPVGGTAAFVFPGLFDGGTRYIPTVAPGQAASMQARVWESAYGTSYEQAQATGGRTGASAILQVTTGGGGFPPSPPAQLVGLQSFSLAPGLPPRALVFIGRNPLPGFLTDLKKIPSGQFQFTLTGDAGAIYTIEASTDLVHWSQLTNVVNSSGAVPIIDLDAANRSQRFYRARPAGQ